MQCTELLTFALSWPRIDCVYDLTAALKLLTVQASCPSSMSQKDIRQFFGQPPVDKTREDVSTNDTTQVSMLCSYVHVYVNMSSSLCV